MKWRCDECDPMKFTGVLKCPHGYYFTKYIDKVLEAAAQRAIDEIEGKK